MLKPSMLTNHKIALLLAIIISVSLALILIFYLPILDTNDGKSYSFKDVDHILGFSGVHGFTKIDDIVGYSGIPGFNTNHPYTFTINSLGFRGRDIPKGAHPLVVIVGASVAMGMGVNDDDTMASYLEKKINIEFPTNKSIVLNAAFGGYSNDQTFQLIKSKILPLKPKYIIWLSSKPQFDFLGGLELFSLNSKEDDLNNLNISNSYFRKSLKLSEILIPSTFIYFRWFVFEALIFWHNYWEEKTGSKSTAIHSKKLNIIAKKLIDIAKLSNIQIIMVLLPDNMKHGNSLKKINLLDKPSIPLFDFRNNLDFMAHQNEFYLKGDYHYTPKGNEYIANQIFHNIIMPIKK